MMTDSVKFFKTIFDNLDTGIYVLDNQGVFFYANRALLKKSNMSRKEIIGVSIYDLLRENVMQKSLSDYVLKTKKEKTLVQEIRNSRSKGSYRHMGTSKPIFDKEGNIQFIIVEAQYIDDLVKKYRQALLSNESGVEIDFSKIKDFGEKNQETHIICESRQMKNLLKVADRVADYDSAVLLKGESGVGKEVVAHFIHDHSSRKKHKMVEINCAALPENLLEAELFGYEKGSFTGALNTGKKGLIEEADGGILFLDEINSLPINLQGKLLRVLETKLVKRIGASEDKYVDFRLISATNQNLKAAIQEGTFRADLYYRINVIPLNIPPLRERQEDIIPLAMYFLEYFCEKYDKNKMFSAKVCHDLMQYSWPGNVRELKNFVERLLIMNMDDDISINEIPEGMLGDEDLSEGKEVNANKHYFPENREMLGVGKCEFYFDPTNEDFSLQYCLDKCEEEVIGSLLKKYRNTYKAAKILKVNQSTIARKKQKYHIEY